MKNMREKFEPKFGEAEIAEKQEEAQEMDKKAEEMIKKGEAKTTQEAVDKMEEKELEKSPEEMLKEVLPLVWEEALKFAKERGFANPKGIKERIDLANKYNLDLEYFFCSVDTIEKARQFIPTETMIITTASELEYTRQFSAELSRQRKGPCFAIFNARCGTVFSYGIDLLSSQLNFQLHELSQKTGGDIANLRKEFSRDLRQSSYFQRGDYQLAWMNTAKQWMEKETIEHLTLSERQFKIPSAPDEIAFDFSLDKRLSHKKVLIEEILKRNLGPVLFVDFGSTKRKLAADSDENEYFPYSFSRVPPLILGKYSSSQTAAIRSNFKKRFDKFYPLPEITRDLIQKDLQHSADVGTAPLLCLNPVFSYGWFDNVPFLFGKMSKKWSHGVGEKLRPDEKILIDNAKQVEYLSEKVKNALRYYQRDEEGRNWFERNFEGIMLGKKEAPEKGTKEYLEMFRKWVPYETDEKGEVVLDDKGYPVPRKTAPMTVAAEDELERVEAAMEELER